MDAPGAVVAAEEVILPRIPECSCGNHGDYLYVHEPTAQVTILITHLETGEFFSYVVIIGRGVYKYQFDEVQDAGYDVDIHSHGEGNRTFKFFQCRCDARVTLELSENATHEEILEVIASLENEPTYYRPASFVCGLDSQGQPLFDVTGYRWRLWGRPTSEE